LHRHFSAEAFVRRQLLNGVLGALATLAVLYAFGLVGLLVERMIDRPAMNVVVAMTALIVALCLGLLVLGRLSPRTPAPADPDAATDANACP
jgi:CHASE2 domain-containing sensor protein